jgi:YfiH family protein
MSSIATSSEAMPAGTPGLERVPGWDRFPWLRAAFSTRQGGRSQAYGEDEQNLGWTREDDPDVVGANRAAFLRAAAAGASMPLVTLQQVHSGLIRDLETEAPPLMSAEGRARKRGDGLLSQSTGRLLGIITADCVPVLVADTRTRAVAAFHAGWRGTLARIAERGVHSMRSRYGSRPGDLVAAIGPCIHACCFAVGDEVRSAFVAEFSYGDSLFSRSGDEIRMDLVEANRRQLLEAGLALDQITALAGCTGCALLPDGRRRFYSHRAERGFAGRMLSVVGAAAE